MDYSTLLERCSRTKRRFKAKLRKIKRNTETSNTDDCVPDETRVRKYLIKMFQNKFFSGTISSLLKGSTHENGDKLMPFTPNIDNDGLLRVGGGLNKAPLTYITNFTLNLHSRSRFRKLLI